MINPETLDLSQLPSKAIENKKELPNSSGIYFAIDSCGVVQYIGQSRNIKQRWFQHHRAAELKIIGEVKISYLLIEDVNLLGEIERALINWFLPFLNDRAIQYDKEFEPCQFNSDRKIRVRLKKIREDRNVSQNALARSLGMSLNTVQRIECQRNLKSIPFDTIEKICDALSCEVKDLLVRDPKIEQN